MKYVSTCFISALFFTSRTRRCRINGVAQELIIVVKSETSPFSAHEISRSGLFIFNVTLKCRIVFQLKNRLLRFREQLKGRDKNEKSRNRRVFRNFR